MPEYDSVPRFLGQIERALDECDNEQLKIVHRKVQRVAGDYLAEGLDAPSRFMVAVRDLLDFKIDWTKKPEED
ncbi:MAG TPA: hypothetical protein VGE45_01030 [Chloroflexia bacterium]